ncbi:MAG: hypothetical protein QOH05_2328 [Acetobacteraceae bacterium]|nr:hypothetical protein [Acetobacteraceae bacterium]
MPQQMIRLVRPISAMEEIPVTPLAKSLRSPMLLRARNKPFPSADTDPYLLVLLADQELAERREDQARCLIDAAYQMFDRATKGRSLGLRLAE